MLKASELKKGNVLVIDQDAYILKDIEIRNPTARGASTLYRFRFLHATSKKKLDKTVKADDTFDLADFVRRQVEYLFQDGNSYTFMDSEDYSQHTLNTDDLDGQLEYLFEGLQGIHALLIDDQIRAIELPSSVELTIVETAPAMKAASASARNKLAIVNTGLEVQVPEYLAVGEMIKINTETNKFMGRV